MKKLVIIIILIILLISGIVLFKPVIFGNAVKDTINVKEITVKAFRFGYSPDIINLNKGDKVKIIINNTDTLHGIRIPDLGLSGDESIEFTAEKTGEFIWYCNNMCGQGHMQMQGKLIIK